jgi:hypothetical protein
MKPMLPAEFDQFTLMPMYYSAYIASIAAAATGTFSLQIRENTAFAIYRIQPRCHSSAAGGFATVTYGDLMITDNGAGRTLFDRKLPVDLVAGLYQYPNEMMMPYIVAGNSTLNFEVTSKEAATGMTFWCILHGVNLYSKDGRAVTGLK